MTANGFVIATNTASPMYLGRKYLHLTQTNQKIKEKISKFETKFGISQDFGCIDGKVSILYAPLNTLTIIYVINNLIHLACKLYVFIKVLLWMLNARGLVINVYDAKVFENSFISKLLRSSKLPAIFQVISNSEVKILNYFIDERAYSYSHIA